MATEKQVKQAIKQVLDSEYMNKMVTFDKGWKFKVKSYNIRTRSRFIPKDERDDYGAMLTQTSSSSLSSTTPRMKWTRPMPPPYA